MRSMLARMSCFLAVVAALTSTAAADPGKPVAVRWWGHALVTIETYWNLTIAIDPWPASFGYENPMLAADVVLITHEHPDHNGVNMIKCGNAPLRGMSSDGKVNQLDVILD